VRIDLRPELDLLDDDLALVLSGLLGLLLLLIPPLAVVHDPDDRRAGVRGDLDQIEVCVIRNLLGAFDRDDPDVFAFVIDQTYRLDPDRIVDTCRRAAGGVYLDLF